MELELKRLTGDLKADFYLIMQKSDQDSHTCQCTAYYHDDWQNNSFQRRERMFEQKIFDGYLLYVDSVPAGWCQCTALGNGLRVITSQEHCPGSWGLTCMILRPEYRKRGLSHLFLNLILNDLPKLGCRRLFAVGHRPEAYDKPSEFLEIPAGTLEKAGLKLVRDHEMCPMYEKDF